MTVHELRSKLLLFEQDATIKLFMRHRDKFCDTDLSSGQFDLKYDLADNVVALVSVFIDLK